MRRLLPLLGVVALLAAGCGSSSSPTAEQFAAKVQTICDEYNQSAGHEIGDERPADPSDPKTTSLQITQYAGLLGRVELLFHSEARRPRGDQGEPSASAKKRYVTFLGVYRQVDAALAQAARAAPKGDRAGLVAALSRINAAGALVDSTHVAC